MNNLVKEVSPLSPTSPRDAVVVDVQVKRGALPESPWKGAALMSAAMFCAAAIDTSVKALAGSYATAEIVLLRTLFALPVALSIAHREGGFVEAFRTDLPLWHLYRGFLACGATFTSYNEDEQIDARSNAPIETWSNARVHVIMVT